jgi:hypothetical protein
MGRVDTSAYRSVLEHFPDLGVTPKLAIDPSAPSGSRRAAR